MLVIICIYIYILPIDCLLVDYFHDMGQAHAMGDPRVRDPGWGRPPRGHRGRCGAQGGGGGGGGESPLPQKVILDPKSEKSKTGFTMCYGEFTLMGWAKAQVPFQTRFEKGTW